VRCEEAGGRESGLQEKVGAGPLRCWFRHGSRLRRGLVATSAAGPACCRGKVDLAVAGDLDGLGPAASGLLSPAVAQVSLLGKA
jgi:hypothetical protein